MYAVYKYGDVRASWQKERSCMVESWEQGRVRGKMPKMKGCGSYGE